MITRDQADREGLNAFRGVLIALSISALFWALLFGAWYVGERWVR